MNAVTLANLSTRSPRSPALLLPAHAPFDGEGVLRFLAARTIDGLDRVEGMTYERVSRLGRSLGSVRIDVNGRGVAIRVTNGLVSELRAVVERSRRIFDLDADGAAIRLRLGKDPLLGRLIRKRPGVRIAGAWDPFEVCIRAIVGQQVSVVAASTILHRIVERFGTRVEGGLLFPAPERLAEAGNEWLGMPGRRCETIRGLSRAVADGTLTFDRSRSLEATVGALVDLPGIGPWTAHYIALRGLSHPDAFPAGDLVLRRAAGKGSPLSERDLLDRAEGWRPFRGYAAMLLWGSVS